MRSVIAAVVLVYSAGLGQAMAQCAGTPLSQSALQTLVSGKYVCAGTFPNATWNELHNAGVVTDYKLGPTDPKDPSTVVASYAVGAVNGYGDITYNYNNGQNVYTYFVIPVSGNTYNFCNVFTYQTYALSVQGTHC